ncbi:hypothetical protein THRCLA_11485 [Thraustotheca clavata]|uniref:FHA domain-containing protein n=1 Tax=Thraustotheca clavata TaxID=74557 RepID=A0A1V9Y7K9_9STRA|nr:hypothetical protein THRCLA_11485 [Thraustotheca clavata]
MRLCLNRNKAMTPEIITSFRSAGLYEIDLDHLKTVVLGRELFIYALPTPRSLDVSFISRIHCILQRTTLNDGHSYSWELTDLSYNGTLINGVRLESAIPYQLHHGQLVEILPLKIGYIVDDDETDTESMEAPRAMEFLLESA